MAQGYWFSRPCEADVITRLLAFEPVGRWVPAHRGARPVTSPIRISV